MSRKRWLVTGGAGFIGSHLVDALVERELGDVVVLDNLHRGRTQFIADHLDSGRVRFVRADIRDPIALKRDFEGIDVVIHLAAQSNVIGAGKDIAYSVETNVTGTVNVLATTLERGVGRVVFSSSREVYGDPQELPVAESAPFAAKNLYGASKVSGEMYCRAFQSMGLDVRILRLGNVYGARDTGRVIPIWLDRAHEALDLEVFGGRQVLDLIGVGVVVDALIKAAEMPHFDGPVNVASGQGTKIVDLAAKILEITGSSSQLQFLEARSEEVIGYTADVTRMRTCLGIKPPADPLSDLYEMAAEPAASVHAV